jgi:hypothetical protein
VSFGLARHSSAAFPGGALAAPIARSVTEFTWTFRVFVSTIIIVDIEFDAAKDKAIAPVTVSR